MASVVSTQTALAKYLADLDVSKVENYALARLLDQSISIEAMCADLDDNDGWDTFETPPNIIASLETTINFIKGWQHPSVDQKKAMIMPLRRAVSQIRGKEEAK